MSVIAATLLIALAQTAFALPRTWDGGGVNSNASTAQNWIGDVAPVAGDNIILDATTNKNMTWDLNISLGSWTQVGYTGTVTVATVYGSVGFTNLNIAGDCVISNGVWTHSANSGGETTRISVTIGGNLILGTNAAVNVTGMGYGNQKGPGFYSGGSNPGGSYGGKGDKNNPPSSGPCYGSIVAPTNLGSGGWSLAGGGAILLRVSGTVTNDGLVCADGAAAAGVNGVGSGGSIFMTAGALTGLGTIRANGGSIYNVGPGGGGRIALVVTNAGADLSLYTGPVLSLGGGGNAGAGTVYKRTAIQGLYEGSLVISNTVLAGPTEINTNVTDTVVGNVFICKGGYLQLFTNQTLTVSGIWSNGATFESQFDSQVIIAGSAMSTSAVYGTNTFMGLTCTNAGGKTILFEAGKTNTVPALGRLTLKGSATATNLILRSTIDGTPWKLNVNALADQSIWYVDVTNADARPGVEVIAMNSLDRGANTNWLFVQIISGETNTWTGSSNTSWSYAANWTLNRPPTDDDFIVIPSSPRYPALDNHRTVNGIEIQAGASLSLAGYNLTSKKTATVAGSITASGTETITFQTNADFAGGTFAAAFSTIAFAGNGGQSVNMANLAFYKINVANTNSIAFSNSFSAVELRCEAASGTRNITFQQGTTVTLRDLVLLGSTAGTNIFLRSAVLGQKWNLAVSGYRSVRGVNVADSDASTGLPIPAFSSKNSGGNLNWFFNTTQAVWLGTSGVNFHDPANWSPAGVPGASSRVLVEAANPMTITNPVTLLDLTVGGGAGLASVTGNAPVIVVENITVLSNGTLALNRPCVISNCVYVLAGGALTHSANTTTETNKLNLAVLGNVGVDINATVDVTGKGYANAQGPGFNNNGGSYGGKQASSVSGPCYGSILAPTNLGSGGWSVAGGGAILLTVAGEIRNDGLICADGVVPGNAAWGAAGGTVNLISGRLTGNGIIRANSNKYSVGPGGGGRIALVTTNAGADFSLYAGAILALGGNYYGGIVGGAGTIYMQSAINLAGRGTVLVNNSVSGYTDLSPGPPGNVANEVNFTPFVITNAARLRLTNDFIVGDIFLKSTNSWLDLGSNTLRVRSRPHALGLGVVTNYGAIVWCPDIPAGVIYSTW